MYYYSHSNIHKADSLLSVFLPDDSGAQATNQCHIKSLRIVQKDIEDNMSHVKLSRTQWKGKIGLILTHYRLQLL